MFSSQHSLTGRSCCPLILTASRATVSQSVSQTSHECAVENAGWGGFDLFNSSVRVPLSLLLRIAVITRQTRFSAGWISLGGLKFPLMSSVTVMKIYLASKCVCINCICSYLSFPSSHLPSVIHSPSHSPVILARCVGASAYDPSWPPQASCPALSYSSGIHLWCFALSHAAVQSLSVGFCCILWGSQSMCWPSLGAGGFRVCLQGARPGAVSCLCPGLQLAQQRWGASPTQPSAGVPLLLEECAEGNYRSCTKAASL